MVAYGAVAEPLMRDAQRKNRTDANALKNNAGTARREPYNTVY